MGRQELQRSARDQHLLTNPARLDRLLGMMARWWAGWSLARIAREYRMTRQRVAALLAQVGCTRSRRFQANRERPDSRRRATNSHVAEARADLLHPLASRLTVRQRAALAWRAQGLVLADIARRLATTPQNVRHLIVAARWRLERLSRPKPPKRPQSLRLPRAVDAPPPPRGEDIHIEWRDLLSGLAGSPQSAEPKAACHDGPAPPGTVDVATSGARETQGSPQDANRATVSRFGGQVAFPGRRGSPNANWGQGGPRGGRFGRCGRGGLAGRVYEATGTDMEVKQC